jgi:type IV pilus assembly protein PilB
MVKGFGEFLTSRRLVTDTALEEAQVVQRESQISWPLALVELGYLSRSELLKAAAAYAGYPYVDLFDYCVDLHALFVIPAHLMERYRVLPLKRTGRIVVIATSEPFDVLAEDHVRMNSGMQVEWVVAEPDQIEAGIARATEEAKGYYL